MNSKDEGMILGELKGFKNEALRRFDGLDDRMANVDKKLTALDQFKVKVTITTIIVLGLIEFGFRMYEITSR